MTATPKEPSFATKEQALLVAQLDELDLYGLRIELSEAMARARGERAEKEAQAEQEGRPPPPPLPPLLGGGCGEEYFDLLIVRGNGPDDPCGILEEWGCSALDSKAYNQRADEIYAYCLAAWNLLFEGDAKLSAKWSWSNIATLEQDPFWSAYENMMRWTLLGPMLDEQSESAILYNGEVVQSSLQAMREGICLLHKLNAELDRLTGGNVEPPLVPDEEPLIPDLPDIPGASNAVMFIGIAVAAAIGLAVWSRLKK